MQILYLTVPYVEELHAEAIARFGGMNGLRSAELLESAVGQPRQSAFGQDAYESLGAKAAAYAYFIVSNHPFIDGNKRTGADAMLAFLQLNGCELNRADGEIEDVIVALAAHLMSKDEFFRWVEDSIVADV